MDIINPIVRKVIPVNSHEEARISFFFKQDILEIRLSLPDGHVYEGTTLLTNWDVSELKVILDSKKIIVKLTGETYEIKVEGVPLIIALLSAVKLPENEKIIIFYFIPTSGTS